MRETASTRRFTSMLLVLVVATLPACGLFGAPRWVERLPDDGRFLFAVGAAGITWDHDPSRSLEIARQRALDELARQIEVHLLPAARQQDGASEASRSEAVAFSEQDLEGVELVDVWVDDDGEAGPPGQTWVLLRLPLERARLIAARSR